MYGNSYYNPYWAYGQPMSGYTGVTQPTPMPAPSAAQGSSVAFVEGDAGAQAMQVAPGSNAMAMDLKAMMVYLKSVDPAGIPTTRKFRMVEEVTQGQQTGCAYATMEDLRRTQDEVQRLSEVIKGLTQKEG